MWLLWPALIANNPSDATVYGKVESQQDDIAVGTQQGTNPVR